MGLHPTVLHAQSLLEKFKQSEAETLLVEHLKDCPDDADAASELGLTYCYSQRELDATRVLKQAIGGHRFALLFDTLKNHLTCRRLLAKKLKVKDQVGEAALKQLGAYGVISSKAGIKLSACLIVKNEEKNLERCPSRLKGFVDEIVVVDTGSTDRTVEIAQTFGCVIGHFDWCNDFSAARNESLRLASGDWALWIDADEELTPNSHKIIREGLIRPHFGGYFIRIINFMEEGSDANQYVHTPVRLFQRLGGVIFEGKIHEQVLPSFQRLGLTCATLSSATIHHHGYKPEEMLAKNKIERTISMLQEELKGNPKDAFQWFNLANAYSVARQPVEAERAASEALKFLDDVAPYGALTYQILASSRTATGSFEGALEATEQAESRGFGCIITQFERAHALFKLTRFDEALVAVNKCMDMPWPDDLTGDFGIKSHKSHVLKSQILAALGQLEEALELSNYALSVDPKFPTGLFAKAAILERMGRLDESKSIFEQLTAHPIIGHTSLRILGRIAMAQRDFSQAKERFSAAFLQQGDLDSWVGWVEATEALSETPFEAYEQYSRIGDPNSEILVNWGRALAKSQQFDEALRKFQNAAELDPNSPNPLLNAGDLLYELGQFPMAAEKYEAALRIEPSNAQAWFVLGNCLFQLDLNDGALLSYRQALELKPDHHQARHNLNLLTTRAA